MGARPMLVFGSIGADERRSMEMAAKAAELDLRVVATIDEAIRVLDRKKLRALLVEIGAEGAERLCMKARGKQNFSNIPIIAVGQELSDLGFAKVFRWGADDLVPTRGAADVVKRLAVLPEPTTLPPPKARGEALVADTEHARCDVIGRVLTNVGYEVRYAIDQRSAEYYLNRPSLKLVVASAEVAPPKSMVAAARKAGNEAIWIVTTRPRDMERHARELSGFDRVATTNAFAPPENLVFLANELDRADIADNRRQRRLLFGTVVHFREEGKEGDDHGFTYNVSEHGMYIRTLIVPEAKRLWIDVRPPHAQRLVRVVGEVRWSRRFGPLSNATAPPGFGVEIVDGLGEDLEMWSEAYRRIAGTEEQKTVIRSDPPGTNQAAHAEPQAQVAREPDGATPDNPTAAERAEPAPLEAPAPPAKARTPPTSSEARSSAVGDMLADALAKEPRLIASTPPDQPNGAPIAAGGAPIGSLVDDILGQANHAAAPAQAPRSAPSEEAPDSLTDSAASDARKAEPASGADTRDPESDSDEALADNPSGAGKTPRKKAPTALLAVLGVVVLGAAGFAVVQLGVFDEPSGASAPETTIAPNAVNVATPPEATAEPVAPAAAPTSAAPSASGSPAPPGSVAAAPTTSASAPPHDDSAEPALAESAPPPATTGPMPSPPSDPKYLEPFLGYLYVASSADAEVVVHGKAAGRTNQWLTVRCGTRFIRLGSAPNWLSDGMPSIVKCQKDNRLELNPD